MRIVPVLVVALFAAAPACTTAPQSGPEIPLASASSGDCIDDLDWAYAARRGAVIYDSTCDYCHQDDGGGITGRVPALAGNSALLAAPERGIRLLLITQGPAARTHGMEYDDMVAMLGDLDESDLADVMTYVLSSWGNCAGPVDADQVLGVAASMPLE